MSRKEYSHLSSTLTFHINRPLRNILFGKVHRRRDAIYSSFLCDFLTALLVLKSFWQFFQTFCPFTFIKSTKKFLIINMISRSTSNSFQLVQTKLSYLPKIVFILTQLWQGLSSEKVKGLLGILTGCKHLYTILMFFWPCTILWTYFIYQL